MSDKSFPSNFYPRKLVALKIPYTLRITRLWEGLKNFPHLTSMNLRGCKSLRELPNFTRIPNLEELNLSGCVSLVEVHQSIGSLDKLVTLNLEGCSNLVKLPTEISLKSLRDLYLRGCSRLEEFPKITGKMDSLRELDISCTGVKELHPSIGNLIELKELNLDGCEDLTTLPCSIYELQNLEILDVSGCSKLVTFPEIKGKMNSLKELYLGGSGIIDLHPSIENLIELRGLYLDGCENLTTLPCSIYELQNLEILDVSRCSKLVTFPTRASISHDNSGSLGLPKLGVLRINGCNLSTADFIGSLDCLETLTELDLSSNNFVSVPVLSKFVNLPRIDLCSCKRLREIPELPPNILKVNARDCESLERFLILPKSLNMLEMILWNCHRFSHSIGDDMMENILLNNQKSRFRLVLPGSEVPKWFRCSKEVAANEKGPCSTCAISFEIPSKLNWENIGVAVCSISCFSFWTARRPDISINGVLIDYHQLPSSKRDLMLLTYIPLSDEIKGKVDQKGWSRYHCQVQFMSDEIKSCGVHLVCQPLNESGMLDWLSSANAEQKRPRNGANDYYHHQQEQQELPSMPPIPDYSTSSAASTSDEIFQTSDWQANLELPSSLSTLSNLDLTSPTTR